MIPRFAPLAVVSLFLASAFAQDTPKVETPQNVVVCRPLQILFSGGTPPYFLSAHPAGQPAAPATVDFNVVESSPFRWTANLAVGTSLFLRIRDSNGAVGESGTFSILEGPDTSCIGQSSSAGGSATESGSTPAGTTTGASSTAAPSRLTTAPASGTTAAASASRSGSGSANGTTSARPSGSAGANSAAFGTYVSGGALGLAAIAGAAILL